MNYLKAGAKEWIDQDVAMYYIGCCLGVFSPPDENFDGFRQVKSILWSSNKIVEMLDVILRQLSQNGVLLCDDEEQKFKWNECFGLDTVLANMKNT